jgi:alpha-ribazole phosphatase
MKSYNLYFFRHGITKGNLNAQYIGHTDLPLTTDSINELHSIKAKYHYPKVDAVFSSPLKRCKDSAEIMFPDNTIITIDDFIEYNFGEFEQCTADDLKDKIIDAHIHTEIMGSDHCPVELTVEL